MAFVEWMQGFPEGWVEGDVYGRIKRSAALRMLGNAVVPQQGAHALRRLTTMDGQEMTDSE